jgi:hypothetical protein
LEVLGVEVAFGVEVRDTSLLAGVFDCTGCVLASPAGAGVAAGVAWGVTGGGRTAVALV